MIKSWYARLLAVRRVSQDNRGKHTAGIDGVKSLTPPERWRLGQPLRLDGKATPLRRTWIPKRGSPEKRPLGIPTQHERARQTLVRQALEPEWEAKLSAHCLWLSPRTVLLGCDWSDLSPRSNFGRNMRSKSTSRNVLTASIIDALLAKTQAPPVIRRQLKAWLKSGIMEDNHLSPTTAGTPQGGTVSPLLALIALHGMEEAITQVYPQARVIAYADDCVVLHRDRQVLEHCQQLLRTWLAEMGLTLNEAKSRISHTLEGDQPGFDFLGFHIRQYRVGKHQSGKRSNGAAPGVQNPDQTRQGQHQGPSGGAWADHSGAVKALPQGALIHQLNPKIRGWANYYRTGVSQAAFGRLDSSHLGKAPLLGTPATPDANRLAGSQAVLAPAGHPLGLCHVAHTPEPAYLHTHSEIAITRHVKVQGNRSPYDGDWVYWSTRQGRHPMVSPRLATLLKRQRRALSLIVGCSSNMTTGSRWIISMGIDEMSRYANLQALHGHCHDAKTREHKGLSPARYA